MLKLVGKSGEGKFFTSDYPIFTFVLLRLFAQKMSWSSHKLSRKVNAYQKGAKYRKILGLSRKEIPSYATLRRFWESEAVSKLMLKLKRYSLNNIRNKKEHLKAAMDSTSVPLTLKVHKAFGDYNNHKKYFGLKLHLLVTSKGFPVLSKVSLASVYDNQVMNPFLSELEKYKPVSRLYVDAAYDDEEIYSSVDGRDLGTLSPTKLNSRRGKSNTYARSMAMKKNSFLLAKSRRQIVEQIFGILKNEKSLIIPWWCNTKLKIESYINWNVALLGFDMLFNKKVRRSFLDRSRVTV